MANVSTSEQSTKAEAKVPVDTAVVSDTGLESNSEESNEKEEEEEGSNDEEEPESSNDEDEQENETHDVVGFGDAMSKILGQNVAEDAQPILAKRTTARMREIQSEKKKTQSARLSAAEKREREQKDMALPDHTTAVQDRKLRMIATKGVVALFNAIEKHQHQKGKKEDGNDKQVKEMSKDNFLGLLKASQQKTTDKSAKTTKSTWSVVQDDFMMGAKLKDWDNQHGKEVGRVRQKGDADVEAVEDVAWKQVGDALNSDDEALEGQKTKHKRRKVSGWTLSRLHEFLSLLSEKCSMHPSPRTSLLSRVTDHVDGGVHVSVPVLSRTLDVVAAEHCFSST